MTLKDLLQRYAGVIPEGEDTEVEPKKEKVVRIKRKLKAKKGKIKAS